MENTDPHIKHHYSLDQMVLSAFGHELRNTLALEKHNHPHNQEVREYLEERIKEIKDRWK